MRSKKVLFVSYVFPPVGGAGVQRTVKFLKYLPVFGWHGSVLTAANPSVPVIDRSLLKDIPADTAICRARTWEPGYSVKSLVSASHISTKANHLRRIARDAATSILQPDPQILWLPMAVRRGLQFLKINPHSAIVATAPPFSDFIVGLILAHSAKLPLILDYRDEWGLSNRHLENKRSGAMSSAIQSRMQMALVRSASAIVATTASSASTLERVRERSRSQARVTCIYNGFDQKDLALVRVDCPENHERVRIVYTGTLWNLTSVEPLVTAIEGLATASRGVVAKLEIVFAGRRTAAQAQTLARLQNLPCRVTLYPHLEHDSALALMHGADVLLALLSDSEGAKRVVPAKIFEYMAVKRPILAIAPGGEMTGILREYPAAYIHDTNDTEGIATTLIKLVCASAYPADDLRKWDSTRYSRESQAGELATVLDIVLGHCRG